MGVYCFVFKNGFAPHFVEATFRGRHRDPMANLCPCVHLCSWG